VLPHAEIRFSFPDDKPHVLGYKAKWDEGSFEYKNTVRTFDFVPEDSDLLKELSEIALESWKLFGLKGYARVDFRVDQDGKIYVLEINANPCISSDSGFVAAALRAGISQKELVKRIVMDINKIV
jgi:D-alanine-D-alanine ligase